MLAYNLNSSCIQLEYFLVLKWILMSTLEYNDTYTVYAAIHSKWGMILYRSTLSFYRSSGKSSVSKEKSLFYVTDTQAFIICFYIHNGMNYVYPEGKRFNSFKLWWENIVLKV